jgi:hypothetical protein
MYIKKFDAVISVDVDAIANLCSIDKDDLIKSHDKLKKLRETVWLNIAVHS